MNCSSLFLAISSILSKRKNALSFFTLWTLKEPSRTSSPKPLRSGPVQFTSRDSISCDGGRSQVRHLTKREVFGTNEDHWRRAHRTGVIFLSIKKSGLKRAILNSSCDVTKGVIYWPCLGFLQAIDVGHAMHSGTLNVYFNPGRGAWTLPSNTTETSGSAERQAATPAVGTTFDL